MRLLILSMLFSFDALAFGDFNFTGFSSPTKSTPTYRDEPTQKIEIIEVPGWVKEINDGGGLRVKNGNEVLFRNITKGTENQRTLCKQSKKDNLDNIKGMFPFVKFIPTAIVRHSFSGPGFCATTISVKKKVLNKLEEIALRRLK